MLILTRKVGQGFSIGDDIMITITEMQGDKVRVGIDAPKHIKVLRSELSEIMEQNVQAAERPATGALKALAMGRKKGDEKNAASKVVLHPVAAQREARAEEEGV